MRVKLKKKYFCYFFLELSDEMYDDGYNEVVNIDISDQVIAQMNGLALKRNRKMICETLFFLKIIPFFIFFFTMFFHRIF